MKKTLSVLLLCCLMMAAPTLKAQTSQPLPTINEACPHEVSAGYGISLAGIAFNTLVDVAGKALEISEADIASVKSGGSRGIINAGYLYHTSKVFAVGGNVGYNRLSVNLQDKTGSLTAASANIFFAMAGIKLNWFRYDIFGMYSKFGLGAMCINGNLMEEYGDTLWLPTAQITPIGMEIGRQLCGFLELGAGMQGILQAGVKYHF
jgi:hypothetical protein